MRTSRGSEPPLAFICRGPAATAALAGRLARLLSGSEVIHLVGGLGAGKTCFVQGLAQGLGVPPASSPTFTLINEYPGTPPLFHVDLYRLASPREAERLGLEEYFGRGITAVEWAERLPRGLDAADLEVSLETVSERVRRVTLRAASPRGEDILGRLARRSRSR